MPGHKKSRIQGVAVSLAALIAGAPALGQEAASPAGTAPQEAGATIDITDIIVTAQRRSERLRDVPIAITALNQEGLAKAGVTNLRDLERVAAGLQLPLYGGFLRPSIRGISSGLSTLGDSSNVAVYVDGVYQPTQSAAIVELPDTQTVQVLKGPQGTLYGQNATGGAIIIDTVAPSFELKGELVASYGNYDEKLAHGWVTGPLGDKIAVAVAGSLTDRGGYNRDLLRGGHDKGLRGHQIRGKLLWQASDDTSFTIAGYETKRNDSGVYTGAPLNGNSLGNAIASFFPGTVRPSAPHTFATNIRPDLLSKTHGFSLLGKIGLGDIGTLNTVSAYQKAQVTDIVDVDQSAINLADIKDLTIKSRAYIQELNFVSEKFGRFSFSAGGFFMDRQESFDPSRFDAYNPPLPYPATPTPVFALTSYAKNKKKSYAGYAEATFDLTDQITLTAAGRYSYEKVRVFGSQNAGRVFYPDPRGSFSFKKFTPRAVLRWKVNDEHMLYASYSKGFKSGFVDSALIGTCPGGPADASCLQPGVRPETVDAFEIGYKGRIADRLNVTLAAFHYDYKDIQVFIYVAPTGFYQNAAKGRVNGVDFDANYEVSRDLKISVAASYIDSKYTEFTGASVYEPTPAAACAAQFLPYPCGNVQVPVDVTGNQLVNAPKFTATAAIDWGHDFAAGRFGINVSGNYNSGFPFDVNDHIHQDRYALLNAELSFAPSALEGLRLVVWGRNLTNHDYIQSQLATTFADLVSWSPPRTYGVRAEYRF
jgi:iron complex outermembrane recepter protein